MTIFEVKYKTNLFHKVWNELYLLLFFNLGLALGNVSFFTSNYLIIELCVFGLLIFSLFNKRNRYTYKLQFNDEDNFLSIYYCQFIILKFEQKIDFKDLQISYMHKRYGRGKIPKTLEIKNKNNFIVEIRQKYNLGWTNKELDEVYDKLEKISTRGIL